MEIDIVDVVESYSIELRQEGNEFIGLCPAHNDTHRSLKVSRNKQIFKCFACNFSGDAYAFQKFMGDKPRTGKKVAKKATRKFHQVSPIPEHPIESPSYNHYKHGQPSKIYPYRNQEGVFLGFTCRFDLLDGKQILPYIYGKDDTGKESWRYHGFADPRPLYGLWDLQFSKNVLIVEGEKTADFCRERLPGVCVISWIGGAMATEKSDWSMIVNKNVLLWPDNDGAGREAMNSIANLLDSSNNIRGVRSPSGVPEHWDVADSGWEDYELKEYLNNKQNRI